MCTNFVQTAQAIANGASIKMKKRMPGDCPPVFPALPMTDAQRIELLKLAIGLNEAMQFFNPCARDNVKVLKQCLAELEN